MWQSNAASSSPQRALIYRILSPAPGYQRVHIIEQNITFHNAKYCILCFKWQPWISSQLLPWLVCTLYREELSGIKTSLSCHHEPPPSHPQQPPLFTFSGIGREHGRKIPRQIEFHARTYILRKSGRGHKYRSWIEIQDLLPCKDRAVLCERVTTSFNDKCVFSLAACHMCDEK